MMDNEAILLQRFAGQADVEAFTILVRRYAGMVYDTCIRILNNQSDAADMTQETFFELNRHAGHITAPLGSWLHSVARNKSLDFIRRSAHRRQRERVFARFRPREVSTWHDLSGHVDEALEQLDESYRVVVVDYYLDGKTMDQIALEHNISQPTVSRRIKEGLELLRGNLKRKGLLVTTALLGTLLMDNTSKAVPLTVLTELTKIAMIGSVNDGLATSAMTVAGATMARTGAFKAVISALTVAIMSITGYLYHVNPQPAQQGGRSTGYASTEALAGPITPTSQQGTGTGNPSLSSRTEGEPVTTPPKIPASAEPYFTLLQEQPGNTYLFDRFYRSWLTTSTVTELETFLRFHLHQYQDLAGRLLLAFFYERQGQDDLALALYREKPQALPATAEFLYYKAKAESRHLAFETAIANLLTSRDLSGSEEIHEKICTLLGELYLRTHQKDKAIDLWQELLAQGHENQGLYEDLIELQIKEGLFSEALQTCETLKSQTQDPYRVVMLSLRMGDIYLYQADTQKALEVYTQALEDVGQESWLESQILAQIEQAFTRQQDTEGLTRYLTRLVQSHRQRLSLKKHLANHLLQTDQVDEALRLYEEILAATPGNLAYQKAYAKVLIEADHLNQAIRLLEQLSRDHSTDHEALLMLADLYHRTQKDEQVVATLNRLLEQSDQTEQAYLRIGRLLEQYHLNDPARTLYQQMMATLPDSLTAKQAYAEFLYRDQQIDAALSLLQSIAQQGDLQTLIRASNAAESRGHPDLALTWVEARYAEFSENVTYLNHLCKIAIQAEAWAQARTWARHQLSLCTDFGMIRSALNQALACTQSPGDIQQLITELEASKPLSIQDICLLSELLEMQGQTERVDDLLRQASTTHPQIALRQQIEIDCLRHHWAQAAQNMERLIQQMGQPPTDLVRDLIGLYQKAHQYEQAIQWVQTWQSLAPSSVDPRLCHARLLQDMGQEEEAIGVLAETAREFDGNPEVLRQQAKLYVAQERYPEAERLYWRLYDTSESTTDQLQAIRHLSEIAKQTGRLDELIDKLKHQQRNSTAPLLGLAQLYKELDRFEEYRQALLAASHLKTDDVQLLYELANAQETQGNWQQAIETLERAQALDQSPQTRIKIATLHLEHGHQEDGLRLLREVAGGKNMDQEAAKTFATALLSTGQWEAGTHFLRELVEQYPQENSLRYQLGIALEENNQRTEALEIFMDLVQACLHHPMNPAQFPGVATHKNRNGMQTNLQQILPADAAELMGIAQCYPDAYAYRRQRGNTSNRGRLIAITLPASNEQLYGFALCHILDLGNRRGSRIQSDLERCGVDHVDLLQKMVRLGLGNWRQAIEQMAEIYPDHQAIQALWIINRIDQMGCTLDEAEHVFDLVQDYAPRLAVCIGLRCNGKEPKAARLFKTSLQMLRSMTDPGYYEIMSMAYCLLNEGRDNNLTQAQHKMMDEHLMRWYGALKNNAYQRVDCFTCIAGLLAQRRDLSGYVSFLDQEMQRQQNTGTQARWPSDRFIVAPLPTPPLALPDCPDHVTRLITENRPFIYDYGQTVKNKPPLAKLAKYTGKIQHPLLKGLITLTADQLDQTRKIVTELMVTDPTCLSAYLLGASLATQQNNPAEAITLLNQSRSLPMSPSYQSLIDGALVANAMQLDPKTFPLEYQIGQQAATRLMSSPLNVVQKEELLIASESLGLTEQAQNLKQQILATLEQANASAFPASYRTRNLDYLFKHNQNETALRCALGLLRKQAENTLYPNLNHRNYSQMSNTLSILQAHRAEKALLSLADSLLDSNARALRQYARICEVMGYRDKARTLYEKALQQKADDRDTLVELALFWAHDNPATSARHLHAIETNRMNQVGQALAERIARLFESDTKRAFELVTVVNHYLETDADWQQMNLDWADRIADIIAADCQRPDNRLNHLYQITSMGNDIAVTRTMQRSSRSGIRTHFERSSLSREDTRLARQRRTLHNQLCQHMLDIDPLAEAGMSRLLTEAKAGNRLTDQYQHQAQQAMLHVQPHPKAGLSFNLSPQAPANNQCLRLICPAEYIVMQANRDRELDKLSQTFLPQLQRQSTGRQADKLTHIMTLYSTKPNHFFETATQFVQTVSQSLAGQSPLIEKVTAMQIVIHAYRERHLRQDQAMSQFILDQNEEDLQQNHSIHPWPSDYWLDSLIQENTTEAQAFWKSLNSLCDQQHRNIRQLQNVCQRYAMVLDPPKPTIRTRRQQTRRTHRRR